MCSSGTIRYSTHPTFPVRDIKMPLKAGPVPVAMVIQGCNDGTFIDRGGSGGVPEAREGHTQPFMYRGCANTDIM